MRDTDLRRYEILAKTRRFARRLDEARRFTHQAAEAGCAVFAMSWGKDSCALGHLACEELGRVEMMHMACAHELPGGELVKDFFASRATVHELPPLSTLQESIEWLRTVGLPHERAREDHQRIIKTRKKDRAREWAQSHGFSVTVMGMRADEAKGRRWCFRARGPIYQLADGHWHANPLAWWSAEDVWTYLVSRGVPWHPMYDAETHGYTRESLRSTGWLYTDGIGDGWAAWLREHYPEQYRLLIAAFPRIAVLT